MANEPKETEIKVLLTEKEAELLRDRLGSPVRTVEQVSYFYETPQDHLAKQKLSLRVREESDVPDGEVHLTVTVKGGGRKAGALFVRPETESQLDAGVWEEVREGRASIADVDVPPVNKLREVFGGLGQDLDELDFALLGSFRNRREVYELSAAEIDLELLLDSVSYPGGMTDFEMESELPQSMAGRGARALRSLFEELGVDWRPAQVGKYVRFRREIGRDPDAAPDASP